MDELDIVFSWRASDGGEIGRGVGKEVLGFLGSRHDDRRVDKGGRRRVLAGRAELWTRQSRRVSAGKLRNKLSTYAGEHH